MRYFRSTFLLAGFFLLSIALLTSSPVRADSFSIYRVSRSSGSISNQGLTISGTLTTSYYGPTPFGYGIVYSTYTPGVGSVISYTMPPLTFDNGASCSVSYSGLSRIDVTRCNGQYSLFSAYNATDYLPSLYLLAGGSLQQLYYGGVSSLLLNSLGDVAFKGLDLPDADTNFLYYNNTTHAAAAVTPEPSSVLLLCSGICCLGLLFWKKGRSVIHL